MSSISNLTKYNPTGAFSFEIFSRNKNLELDQSLAETFFLLGPVDQSIDEPFKLTVNKTIGGAWVDDFGNDVKKIILSGELYSYYFGNPLTASASTGVFGIDLGRKLAGDVVSLKDTAISDFTGVAGLDEYFKLRYILSRFRDTKASNLKKMGSDDSKMKELFPGLSSFFNAVKNIDGVPTYKDFGFVYHDYDDGNHFEVVIEKFNSKRSASDPFTLVYTIEMTAIKPYSTELRTFGKLGKGLKETVLSIIKSVSESFNEALNITKTATGFGTAEDVGEIGAATISIPTQISSNFSSMITQAETFSTTMDEYIKGVRTDYAIFKADAKKLREEITTQRFSYLTASSSITEEDLANETSEIPENNLELYNLLSTMEFQMSIAESIDFYGNNNESQNIFIEEDEPSVKDTDFDSETQGGGTTNSSQNATQSVNYIFYIVEAGDDLAKIAQKFYKDFTLGPVIGQSNNLSNEEFYDDELVGSNIKIPLLGAPVELSNNYNLVYTNISQLTPTIQRQKQVLGSDLKLNSNREILVDGSGDLAINSGVDSYIDNIEDRLSFPQGILGPTSPGWGIRLAVGDIPTIVKIDKIVEYIESQIYSDPRTESCNVIRNQLELEGDSINIPVSITPISGSEQVIDASKLVPGNFI